MLVISCSAISAFIITVLIMLATAGRPPFGAKSGSAVSAATLNKSIFRQQMAELESLHKHGLLDDESARETRLELARRLLDAEKHLYAEDNAESVPGSASSDRCGPGFRLFLSCTLIFIPVFSGLVYYYQGQPEEPDHPFAAFMARAPASLNLQEKTVRLEVLAARNPHSGQYADDLAAAYLQLGRFQDAANAYNRALALNGENTGRLLGYALALTGFEDGVVGKDAETAFRNVLRLDPQNHQAQLFLARGLMQNGKKEEAIALLQGFLQKTPLNSFWRKDLQMAIAALKNPQTAEEQGQKFAQAPALTREQHDFIAANLEKLEAKLKAEPDNLRAWTMLLNAYLLLGQADKAQAVLQKGLAAMPPETAKQLAAFARQKGLKAAKTSMKIK